MSSKEHIFLSGEAKSRLKLTHIVVELLSIWVVNILQCVYELDDSALTFPDLITPLPPSFLLQPPFFQCLFPIQTFLKLSTPLSHPLSLSSVVFHCSFLIGQRPDRLTNKVMFPLLACLLGIKGIKCSWYWTITAIYTPSRTHASELDLDCLWCLQLDELFFSLALL